MSRARFCAALLLALLTIPAAAQDFGSQWTLPCGQQGPHNAESQVNRIANLMAAAKLIRVGFEISGPTFDPNRTEVILQECWTPGTFLAAADAAGARLMLVGFLHNNGAYNGNGYHQSPPLLNKQTVKNWWQSLIAYIQANHPGMLIVGANGKGIQYVALGNEFGYCPTCSAAKIVEDYFKVYDHVEPVWPSQWIKIEGGLGDGRTNVTAQQINSRNLWASVHCNGDSDKECRDRLKDCTDKFNNCVIDEDIVPGGGRYRYQLCKDNPKCRAYVPIHVRNSGNPPASTCCFKVHGCGSNDARNELAWEACGYEVNEGQLPFGFFARAMDFVGFGPPVGTVDNYAPFIADAKNAGTAVAGYDFYARPNTIEDGAPPPPPPPVDPPVDPPAGDEPIGYAKWISLQKGWDAWGDAPEHADKLQNRYRQWLSAVGLEP